MLPKNVFPMFILAYIRESVLWYYNIEGAWENVTYMERGAPHNQKSLKWKIVHANIQIDRGGIG